MQRKKLFLGSIVAGLLFVAASAFWLSLAQPVSAQCGSQASSCKNCHEVQGQMPVNADGTAWHQSHAFGDFCYICHAGNNQAVDKEAAHAGMVPPLSDVKASCQQCHPDDLMDRAQVYAATLGTPLDPSGPAAATGQTEGAGAAPAASSGEASVLASGMLPASGEITANDPNTIDYVQRYEETVLGKRPTNWGNVILMVLIGAIVVGGGSFVLQREGWVRIVFEETKPVEAEYPADVVDMLPEIAQLKPNARKALRRLLKKQPAAAELLVALDRLTPEDLASPDK